jgi:hypothetical protein
MSTHAFNTPRITPAPRFAEPRVLNPNAPLALQIEIFLSLATRSPERSVIQFFSPELSDWLLQNKNDTNRKQKPKNIARYTKAMENDEWFVTGEPLIFARDTGRVLDGQNRLAACVIAGKPFKTHSVFGIDPETFKVIQSGVSRSNKDVFRIFGARYPELVAGAVRWIKIYHMFHESGERVPNRSLSFENRELLDYFKSNMIDRQTLYRSLEQVNKSRFHHYIPKQYMLAYVYLFNMIDPDATEALLSDFERLGPKHKLARKLKELEDRVGGRGVHETTRNAFLVISWKAKREHRKLALADLVWNRYEDHFPSID